MIKKEVPRRPDVVREARMVVQVPVLGSEPVGDFCPRGRA